MDKTKPSKRSLARMAYWKKKTKEERSEYASMMARAKHAKMTKKERSDWGKMMRKAKDKKASLTK